MNWRLALNIAQFIATELNVKLSQVEATISLLDEGATVPFIARYRKEATGGLSDTQLRDLSERLAYLKDLISRQQAILKSIEEQGKLTPTLKEEILAAQTKTRLEDLYLPYKPKRRTKAQIAKEAGLEPLAEKLFNDLDCNPEHIAQQYINKDIVNTAAALEGARYILMEMFAENADLLEKLRNIMRCHGALISKVAKNKTEEGAKFSDYFDFNENVNKIPSHRILAVFRGRNEGILHLCIDFLDEQFTQKCHETIANAFSIHKKLSTNHWLWQTIIFAWKVKLQLKLELELMSELKSRADEEAIHVFRDNLQNLLMAAPAGNSVVLGLDPGYRTGVKTVVTDGTGKLLAHTVIYPHAPQKEWDKALYTLSQLCNKHDVKLISIGNGTASRETDQLAAELIKKLPNLNMQKIVVSEAGASVYSASKLAANEFPDLDVSYRGAVSIARRLQDPLAELVKIEPKSIGVGQYQHDVNQVKLERSLNAAVEDCVNAVGADINTASVPLLTSISGLNATIAENIVQFREKHGRFKNRNDIKLVARLGDKVFEQAAGFLRIMNGENPLDASAVHPESYGIVEQIARRVGKPVNELIANQSLLNSLDLMQFVTDKAGLPTIRDIVEELKKPGRDPRPEFKMAQFAEGLHDIKDLKVGMVLEGVITNVANFGAFVDIGVHQDGLVHVSQIADHFVKDLHQEVKVGQIVKVRVLEIDESRHRISLTMKKNKDEPTQSEDNFAKMKKSNHKKTSTVNTINTGFADQLRSALKKKDNT